VPFTSLVVIVNGSDGLCSDLVFTSNFMTMTVSRHKAAPARHNHTEEIIPVEGVNQSLKSFQEDHLISRVPTVVLLLPSASSSVSSITRTVG
jgi:hypothetical protein